MIPRSATEVKKVKTPDGSATLHLRYLLGEYQDRFLDLQKKSSSEIARYRAPAEKNVTAKNHGKSRKELIPLISAEMERLASEDGVIDRSSGFADSKEMIDIFLCGWDAPGWPGFPTDGRPSRMFLLGDLGEISELISSHIDELAGLTKEEAKN